MHAGTAWSARAFAKIECIGVRSKFGPPMSAGSIAQSGENRSKDAKAIFTAHRHVPPNPGTGRALWQPDTSPGS